MSCERVTKLENFSKLSQSSMTVMKWHWPNLFCDVSFCVLQKLKGLLSTHDTRGKFEVAGKQIWGFFDVYECYQRAGLVVVGERRFREKTCTDMRSTWQPHTVKRLPHHTAVISNIPAWKAWEPFRFDRQIDDSSIQGPFVSNSQQ